MILTVTLNLALDVTYHVADFEPGSAVRVEDVARRAGGKGVNVARVLQALRHEVTVSGMVGGFTGQVARRAEICRLAGRAGRDRGRIAADGCRRRWRRVGHGTTCYERRRPRFSPVTQPVPEMQPQPPSARSSPAGRTSYLRVVGAVLLRLLLCFVWPDKEDLLADCMGHVADEPAGNLDVSL